jgi:hypothetical protein
MHLCIWVGAAIADDDQPISQIAGVANGRQHDAVPLQPDGSRRLRSGERSTLSFATKGETGSAANSMECVPCFVRLTTR